MDALTAKLTMHCKRQSDDRCVRNCPKLGVPTDQNFFGSAGICILYPEIKIVFVRTVDENIRE